MLGKYLSAKEAYDAVTAERQKVLFLDVRTEAELMFVGMTGEVDVQVPFVELAHPTAWDEKNNRLQLVPHPSFLATVEAALARKGLGKADKVLVMCRSGDRSAKAVNALAAAGYANVWSVYDGFEGDLSKEGHRTVNGWKNAGLPWIVQARQVEALCYRRPGPVKAPPMNEAAAPIDASPACNALLMAAASSTLALTLGTSGTLANDNQRLEAARAASKELGDALKTTADCRHRGRRPGICNRCL